MGLFSELGINPGQVNIDKIAKEVASGGVCPEGVHHAILEEVGPIPNATGFGWKLKFKVIAGPGEGCTVDDVVWKPKGEDPKKDAKVNNRIMLYGHRLGLLRRDDAGNLVEIPGKAGFEACIGAACFIEVKHKERTYEAKGVTHKVNEAQLSFEGVLSPDDKKVKDVPKATSVPAVAARPAGGAGGANQFANL